ncbi:MAG: hypothetical protein JWO95_2191, partial [Verrucomicrobiales bacterium]|nr:hypothetical protein [Verrucomicrobiales bacterium]
MFATTARFIRFRRKNLNQTPKLGIIQNPRHHCVRSTFFMKMLRPFLLTVVLSLACSFAQAEPKKVLVVTATEGWPHTSVTTAERVLTKLGTTSGAYKVVAVIRSGKRPEDTAEQNKWMEKMRHDCAELMSPAALNEYDAVIFANTTGELPVPDRDAFISWIKAGHAFIGMHSAIDTFH